MRLHEHLWVWFMEAGGYDDPNYWSPEGWKWKESDVIVYYGIQVRVVRTARPYKEEKHNQPERWEPEQEDLGAISTCQLDFLLVEKLLLPLYCSKGNVIISHIDEIVNQ